MEFDVVYSVKKEFGEDEFLRQLLINLGTNANTPVDVVNAKFGEVSECVKEVLVCTAQVDGFCTASVGYDRQEPYTDYETYREKVGNSYVTRQRAVTKYRTVTDWRPFQQNYSGEATCAAFNDSYGHSNNNMVIAIKTANTCNFVEKGEAIVYAEGLAKAISNCEINVECSEVSFPGDRHKDAHYNSESSVKSISCYKLPMYEVSYIYEGKEYHASCFACGKVTVDCEVPQNNIDIKSETIEKTKSSAKAKNIAWWSFAGTAVLSLVMCFAAKVCWLWFLPVISLVAAIYLNNKYNKEYIEYSEKLSTNFETAKIEELKKAIERSKYRQLSSAEEQSVEIKNATSIPHPKRFKGKAIICSILAAIIVITSLICGKANANKRLHSPSQIDISITNIEHEYDPDASPYINGCYYIYIDFNIKTKKIGVEYINLKVHIKDKSGEEIGVLKSSLEYLNIDANSSKIARSTWSDNQPEKNKNAFFIDVYNSDFNDLTFTYEIGSIQFSDGQYYHNSDYNQFGY